MKTLIVDDDFVNRELLKAIMKPYGTFMEACDGVEAVACFKNSLRNKAPFDLVLLDIMMPNMDGHATLAALRSLEREHKIKVKNEAKVIMVTSMDDPKNIIQATRYGGCTDYVLKPIKAEDLKLKLRTYSLID